MKTHQQFIEEVKNKSPEITILGTYSGTLSEIKAKCEICNYVWNPKATYLSRGGKCPICRQKPKEIPNAIIFTHPHIAKMMANEIDSKIYSYGSGKKVDWVCPGCGEIVKDIVINKVVARQHIPCKKCSDGISYPNKYMSSMLKQLNISFETEYSPEWISPKRYDFYISDKKLIIEMDGAIGHGNKSFDGRSIKELLEVDSYKNKLAQENGLHVIRIDCKISDSDFISKNIINSEISKYFDISFVDWGKCNYDAYSSLKKRVIDLWNEYEDMGTILQETGLSRCTIVRYLQCGTKYGWCNYDGKLQRIKSGEKNILLTHGYNSIPVICLNTNQVFDSLRRANIWAGLNINSHSIKDNCVNKLKTAGSHPVTKERLRWAFVSDLEGMAV